MRSRSSRIFGSVAAQRSVRALALSIRFFLSIVVLLPEQAEQVTDITSDVEDRLHQNRDVSLFPCQKSAHGAPAAQDVRCGQALPGAAASTTPAASPTPREAASEPSRAGRRWREC